MSTMTLSEYCASEGLPLPTSCDINPHSIIREHWKELQKQCSQLRSLTIGMTDKQISQYCSVDFFQEMRFYQDQIISRMKVEGLLS